MNLYNQMNDTLDSTYKQLKKEYEAITDEPLIHLAKIFSVYKRYDDSKHIYLHLLKQNINRAMKIVCYSDLAQLAVFNGNNDEMMFYNNKLEKIKFGD